VGLQLPGELISLLGLLGYNWPEADEEKLFEMGQAWIGFAQTIDTAVQESGRAATEVWSQRGADIDAFRTWWTGDESPSATLSDGSTAAVVTGTGLIVCAGIVLALKISVMVQLICLAAEIAEALATSELTFGASLLEIPVFQQIARTVIENLIQDVLWQLADA
jgi:hypothetical protein